MLTGCCEWQPRAWTRRAVQRMPLMDASIRVGVKEAAAWGSCMAGHSGSSLPSSRVSCVHREGDEFVYDKLSKLLPKHTPPTLPSTPLITFLRKLHRILSGVKEALASYSDTLPPTGGHPDGKLRHSLLLPPLGRHLQPLPLLCPSILAQREPCGATGVRTASLATGSHTENYR